jgi:hypothetical protein
VLDDPGEGDPDVAVQEALLGRPGRRVVVDAGPLHVRAVARRRAVVLGEHDRRSRRQAAHAQAQQQAVQQAGRRPSAARK